MKTRGSRSRKTFLAHVRLFADGACKGNPGPGAIGIMICDADNQVLDRRKKCLGETTNHRAEYRALIRGLKVCADYTRGLVSCYLDSRLVVNQMTGLWQVNDHELLRLFSKAKSLERIFDEVEYCWLSRRTPQMQMVNALAGKALRSR